MAKLEGVIYKAFDQYVVLRGFAPIGDLATVSKKPNAYQRPANDKHKGDIIKFLADREYTYFPEIILAFRARNYQDFIKSIGLDASVDAFDSTYVDGLRVLKERVPAENYRAKHAFLSVNTKTLTRVDGNHRLEPFDESDDWWENLKIEKEPIQKLLVPFTIIFSEEEFANEFEAGIFHNINFKQLPLRQEASLKIITQLDVFKNIPKLGAEYPLAIELIDLANQKHFVGLPYLTPSNEDNKDVFRTACLRISKLLSDRSIIADNIFNENEKVIKDFNQKISSTEQKLVKDFTEPTDYEKALKEGQDVSTITLDEMSISKIKLQSTIAEYKIRRESKIKIKNELEGFLSSVKNLSKIVAAIQSLRPIYMSFGDKHGNLSLLSALVYYKLLDQQKFETFVSWSKRNQINFINTVDDLPIHSSDSLVEMFERIYESKKRRVFISMQFGDDQSEMIYEKICQTIENYNKEIGAGFEIMVKPIRIDRTIAPHSFTISEEIMTAIKDCSLIIADLSSGNKNVYHEIGYAMGVAEAKGLTPPVILLYKENTTYKPKEMLPDNFIGFNLRGFSQLRFKTYDELTNGLKERLKLHFDI